MLSETDIASAAAGSGRRGARGRASPCPARAATSRRSAGRPSRPDSRSPRHNHIRNIRSNSRGRDSRRSGTRNCGRAARRRRRARCRCCGRRCPPCAGQKLARIRKLLEPPCSMITCGAVLVVADAGCRSAPSAPRSTMSARKLRLLPSFFSAAPQEAKLSSSCGSKSPVSSISTRSPSSIGSSVAGRRSRAASGRPPSSAVEEQVERLRARRRAPRDADRSPPCRADAAAPPPHPAPATRA